MLEATPVVVNERVAEGLGLLVVSAPHVATHVEPGQFVHLRIAEGADFILRRPFSVHRAVGDRIEILYQVVGRGTRQMSELEQGDLVDVVGPLGTGWSLPDHVSHALLVAGGLGAAPLGMWAERLAERGVAVSVAQGAPSAERLVARELFERVARRVEVATDDGSIGERGLVTGPAERLMRSGEIEAVFACGPERMQRAIARMAAEAGIPCQVSLERLMACGIGACLSCVVSTAEGLRRACVDGPVFDASTILWETSEIPPRH